MRKIIIKRRRLQSKTHFDLLDKHSKPLMFSVFPNVECLADSHFARVKLKHVVRACGVIWLHSRPHERVGKLRANKQFSVSDTRESWELDALGSSDNRQTRISMIQETSACNCTMTNDNVMQFFSLLFLFFSHGRMSKVVSPHAGSLASPLATGNPRDDIETKKMKSQQFSIYFLHSSVQLSFEIDLWHSEKLKFNWCDNCKVEHYTILNPNDDVGDWQKRKKS